MELVDDERVSNDSDSNSTDRERRIAFYIKAKYSFDKWNKAAEHDKQNRHHSRKLREVVDVVGGGGGGGLIGIGGLDKLNFSPHCEFEFFTSN